MTGPQRKRLVSIGTFGTLFTLLVLAADAAHRLDPLERALYDFRVRRCRVFARPPAPEVAHVDIDENALDQLGKWPWRRARLAEHVDELSRSGAKLIVLDILFSEPEELQHVRDAAGQYVEVDHDARLADSIRRAGNVVVAASLFPNPPGPTDPLAAAMVTGLVGDLELAPAALAAVLGRQGLASPDLGKRVAAAFQGARGDAMSRRLDVELEGGAPATAAVLAPRLLPRAAAAGRATSGPLYRQLGNELAGLVAARALRRFAAPPAPDTPTLVNAEDGLLPIAPFAAAAAHAGCVDYLPESDGVVRSIPLVLSYRGRLVPQLGVAAAYAVLGVDPSRLRVTADGVYAPRHDGSGDFYIPTHVHPTGPFRGTAAFFHVPLSGRTGGDHKAWEVMYDHPHYREPKARLGMADVRASSDARARLKKNTAVAAQAMRMILRVIDPSRVSEVTPDRAEAVSPDELQKLGGEVLDELGFQSTALASVSGPDADEAAELERLRKLGPARATLDRALAVVKEDHDRIKKLEGHVRGRVVFVGSVATGAFDFVSTSVGPNCPGVYLHGATFNAILTGEFWRTAPRWVTMLATVLIGLLTTVSIAIFSPPRAFAAILLLAGGYAAVNGFLLFDRHNLIVGAAGPLVAAGVVWSGVTLIQFVREIGERTRLTRRFRSYVDPTLVSYVIENPDQARLEAREQELSVVFTDLAGFTTLSEVLRTESAKMLGRYMEVMVPLIRARRGYVNKFLGDGIMCFFGAPLDNPEHAPCAVAAVLDMQAALGPFNADLASRRLPTLSMRAGVSSGLMVVGDAGPSFASDYTVLGDAVNLAARLESANKAMGTNNLITARTAELSGGRFLTRPVANLLVVGKQQPMWVHEALATTEAATAEQKRTAEMTAAFVHAFNAQEFEACLRACRAFEEAFGTSKLSGLYAAEAATCLRNPPGREFCGLIQLQAK